MAGLVVGIYAESDPQTLESALSAQQIDLGRVKVVSTKAGDPDAEASALDFVDVIAEMEDNSFADDMTRGVGVIPDSGGTSVPGLDTRHEPSLEAFTPHESATREYLSGFSIPADEAENFGDAVAEGRAVVLYPDPGSDEERIAAAFKAAGLRNVRAY